MKMDALLRSAALVTAIALIPVTTAGMAQIDGRMGPQFSQLFTAYQQVKANYVDEVSDDQLIRGAINGMLSALDPHSTYVDGTALQRLTTMIDGNYSGLGLSVVLDEGAVKVVSPFKGSPADKAGIKSGDFITHLNGELIYGNDLDSSVARMRGEVGTAIELTLFRPGRDVPLEITVTRGVIELEPVTFELKSDKIGYISVNEFSTNVGRDVYTAWQEIDKEAAGAVSGLILDLRSNPGGSLDEAVALSDLFLSEGRIVSQRGRVAREDMHYDADSYRNYRHLPREEAIKYMGEIAANVPLLVLINAGSASASEIVAGALQDHQRALVMGERSFGKGSVQSLLPLGRDAAIKLTTALYYTPSGNSVQEGGIKPDVLVPQLTDPDLELRNKYLMRESDLRGHLVNDLGIEDAVLESETFNDPDYQFTAAQLADMGIEDFQLHYAIETLNRNTHATVALGK
jgi:carboxyl-terminal processing protease